MRGEIIGEEPTTTGYSFTVILNERNDAPDVRRTVVVIQFTVTEYTRKTVPLRLSLTRLSL